MLSNTVRPIARGLSTATATTTATATATATPQRLSAPIRNKPMLAEVALHQPPLRQFVAAPFGPVPPLPRAALGIALAKKAAALSPPSFLVDKGHAVFVDMQRVQVQWVLDPTTRRAKAKATVEFVQPERGFPVIDLVPDATSVNVDGKAVPPEKYATVRDPDNQTNLRVLKKELAPGRHRMEIEYDLVRGVQWDGDGVSFFSEMSDLADRRFAEQYMPANFEFDQYKQTMEIRVLGAAGNHKLLANGRVTTTQDGDDTVFNVEFPGYFTASSFFIHLLDPRKYAFVEQQVETDSGVLPLTVYARSAADAASGARRAVHALEELEGHFGPFPHDSYIVRVGGSGGMEHSGATMTSLSALGHETTHQWLARGTIPANGNAGWMDEALASWRDNGFPRPLGLNPLKRYAQLSGRSPYQRTTPRESYSDGAKVMGELDFVFRDDGGLIPQIRDFVAQYRHRTVTTEMFVSFLERRWPAAADISARDFFDSRVFGIRTKQMAA